MLRAFPRASVHRSRRSDEYSCVIAMKTERISTPCPNSLAPFCCQLASTSNPSKHCSLSPCHSTFPGMVRWSRAEGAFESGLSSLGTVHGEIWPRHTSAFLFLAE